MEFESSLADAKQALQLDRNKSNNYLRDGKILLYTGHLDDALVVLNKAMALDPVNVEAMDKIGELRLARGEYTDAKAAYLRALQLRPDDQESLQGQGLGLSFMLQGEFAPARSIFEQLKVEDGRPYLMALLQIKQGPSKDADAVLTAFIKEHGSEARYVANLYAVHGQADKAFEWLQRTYVQREDQVYTFKTDPLLNNLHRDPRFAAMLKKMGLED